MVTLLVAAFILFLLFFIDYLLYSYPLLNSTLNAFIGPDSGCAGLLVSYTFLARLTQEKPAKWLWKGGKK